MQKKRRMEIEKCEIGIEGIGNVGKSLISGE